MNRVLCKGYAIMRYTDTEALETMYAVLENGTVLQTKESRYAVDFTDRKWSVSEKDSEWVRTNAYFIGNYVPPVV